MLEGLDDIDWSKLSHAYGSATNVPALLRKMVEEDANPSTSDGYGGYGEDAFGTLLSAVHHQCTIYEATPYVVPFFLQFLRSNNFHNKGPILGELNSLVGHGSKDGSAQYRELVDRYGVNLTDDDRTVIFAEQDEWDAVSEQIDRAIKQGLPLYIQFLQDSDKRLRSNAASVLSYFKQHRAQTASLLWSAIVSENNRHTQYGIIRNFGSLMEGDVSYLPQLMTLHDNVEDIHAPVVIAASAARMAKSDTPLVFIEELVEAFGVPSDLLEDVRDYVVEMSYRSVEGLAGLGVKHSVPALLGALQRFSIVDEFRDAETLDNILKTLLVLVLGAKKIYRDRNYDQGTIRRYAFKYTPRCPLGWNYHHYENTKHPHALVCNARAAEKIVLVTRDSLSDTQRTVIAAIVHNDVAWEFETNLYEMYGLPNGREELRALVSG